jgi:GTP-binding protein EngB required for normal cell division
MKPVARIKSKIPKAVLNRAKREEKEFEEATVQGGIIGVTGNGKSSLINALVGKDIADVGVRETTGVTSKISGYEFHNIILIDLPGVGTRNWKTESYFSDLSKKSPADGKYSLAAKDFDFFILVLANRILDEDLHLYKLITRKLKKPCFLVRSKFDVDADNNWRTKRKSENATYREIKSDVWRNFPAEKRDRVFVISTAEPERGDFDELEAAIQKELPEVKADKFLAFSMAYSKEGLKKKRTVAEKHAGRIAILSAANAFNPVPGLGIVTDIALLLKLSHDLVAVYGLTTEQLDHEIHLHSKSRAWANHLKRNALKAVESLLTSKGIMIILRRLGVGLETKELLRWLPYVGQAVGAVLGYRLSASYAQEAIARCESQALQLSEICRGTAT